MYNAGRKAEITRELYKLITEYYQLTGCNALSCDGCYEDFCCLTPDEKGTLSLCSELSTMEYILESLFEAAGCVDHSHDINNPTHD